MCTIQLNGLPQLHKMPVIYGFLGNVVTGHTLPLLNEIVSQGHTAKKNNIAQNAKLCVNESAIAPYTNKEKKSHMPHAHICPLGDG
jgi:hypothetical protein